MKQLFFLLILTSVLIAQTPLPSFNSSMFTASGNCAMCHTGTATVLTHNGVDVSPPTHWRSTMMANSSKDPLWQAMVSEETHEFPAMKDAIETICTKCHAPMGNTQAKHDGFTNYTLEMMRNDPLGKDGISCTVCHQIDPANLGMVQSYSGNYKIDTTRIIYGPYQNPFSQPMVQFVNFQTRFSAHVNNSELCATCHTLFTPYFDYNNQQAGIFPEQTPYLEWKNSIYSTSGIECQTCHMPSISDSLDISSIPAWHTATHAPFFKHEFVGANKMMLRMLQNNIDSLGVTAGPDHFDSTLARTTKMLSRTAQIEISAQPNNDSLDIKVVTTNLTGHKLPSGIPIRRMWLHLKVTNSTGQTVFESGEWGSDGEITGIDPVYERHHDVIRDDARTQIYEGVLVDVNGNVTNTLLRAASYIKDNRLPPKGFVTSHVSYDSTSIEGVDDDPNFNYNGSIEGSGSDIVTYRIKPTENGDLTITAELCYQTLKPQITARLATLPTLEAERFTRMNSGLPRDPGIVTSASTVFTVTSNRDEAVQTVTAEKLTVHPNPARDNMIVRFNPGSGQDVELALYNTLGEKVATVIRGSVEARDQEIIFNTSNLSTGVYFLLMKSGQGVKSVKVAVVK